MEGFTDIFAVGPPEIRFVKATAPDEQVSSLVSPDVAGDLDATKFLVEAVLPSDFDQNVTGEILSLNRCSEPLEMKDPIGALAVQNIAMTKATSDSRSARFRSSASNPFVPIQGVQTSDVPSPPPNVTLVQLQIGGSFRARAVAGAINLEGQQQDRRPRKGSPAEPLGTINLLSTNEDTRAVDYVWSITVLGRTLSVTTRRPVLQYILDLDAAADDLTATPVRIRFPRDNANRRAEFTYTQTARNATGTAVGNVVSDTVLVSLGGRTGSPLPADPLGRDAEGRFRVPAASFYSDNAARFSSFADLSARDQTTLRDGAGIDANTFANSRFLVYQNRREGGAFGATFVALEGAAARQDTINSLRMLGTVFYEPTIRERLDAEDFNAAVIHEIQHIRTFAVAAGIEVTGITDDDRAFGDLKRRAFINIYNHHFDGGAGAATRQEWESAARRFVNIFSEVNAYFISLRTSMAGGNASNFFIANEAEKLSEYFRQVVEILRDGVRVAAAGGEFREPLTGTVRDRIVEYLQFVYIAVQKDPTLRKVSGIVSDDSIRLGNRNAQLPTIGMPYPVDQP